MAKRLSDRTEELKDRWRNRKRNKEKNRLSNPRPVSSSTSPRIDLLVRNVLPTVLVASNEVSTTRSMDTDTSQPCGTTQYPMSLWQAVILPPNYLPSPFPKSFKLQTLRPTLDLEICSFKLLLLQHPGQGTDTDALNLEENDLALHEIWMISGHDPTCFPCQCTT